jgi:hypothetical protein
VLFDEAGQIHTRLGLVDGHDVAAGAITTDCAHRTALPRQPLPSHPALSSMRWQRAIEGRRLRARARLPHVCGLTVQMSFSFRAASRRLSGRFRTQTLMRSLLGTTCAQRPRILQSPRRRAHLLRRGPHGTPSTRSFLSPGAPRGTTLCERACASPPRAWAQRCEPQPAPAA